MIYAPRRLLRQIAKGVECVLPVIHLELPHTLHLLTAKASVIRQLVAVGLSEGGGGGS